MPVIFIGPNEKPITGQSISFHTIARDYSGGKYIICYGGEKRISKVFSVIRAIFLLVAACLTRKYNKMYITTSRSKFGFFRDFFLINISKAFSIKVINHLHGADFKTFYSLQGSMLKRIIYYTYKKIDCSIVLLPRMREQYDMFPSMNVISISNGVRDVLREPDFGKKNKHQILYLSNIIFSKGIIYLILAVDAIKAEGYDIELIIAGDIFGDEYKTKNEMSDLFFSSISGKNYIKYIGVVSGDDKHTLLYESAFFVLPSFYSMEAQPISVIEAMQYGCAVIVADHNYISDFIDDSNGALIRPMVEDDIKNAIVNIMNDESTRLNIFVNNINYSKREFSLYNQLKKINSLFNK